ncbi:hypothetical protein SAMN05216389_109169 [Oceanobacillus limi]|uniref:Uncharacterized protein n=1 Tax=Oceanobacillus limi TaxID=930131 RepID=A0A1I0DTY7_9BACI|nr:hypothetical protein [Oceanobacillus limi]SET36116.1 hypothetical protein SAMN05216389_109169 [Oceanobacillus limi]
MIWMRLIMLSFFSISAISLLSYQGIEISMRLWIVLIKNEKQL